jgi:dipeptidyl aminopeptidase/acylaminoacyl peptidase
MTLDLLLSTKLRLGPPQIAAGVIYWIEGRPLEGGRNVIVRRTPDGRMSDLTPPGWNVRTLVHEYGGGAYTVVGSQIYFVNLADQRIYRQDLGDQPVAMPQPVTAASAWRYADIQSDPGRQRLIAVGEDHHGSGEPHNQIIAIELRDGAIQPLVLGRDFVAMPRLSPDHTRLAWLAWDHPNMPWDAAEAWVAPILADGSLGAAIQIAGGVGDSVTQIAWSTDGDLLLTAERSGWWNLYRAAGGTGQLEVLHPRSAEFGQPLWSLANASFAPLPAGRTLACYAEQGDWQIGVIDAKGDLQPLPLPYREYYYLASDGQQAVCVAGSPSTPIAVVLLDLATFQSIAIRGGEPPAVDPAYLSIAETISFPTSHGAEAFGYYYRPCNPEYAAPAGELPPLLVMSHGGPTGQTNATLNLVIQYWTSRGFAVLDVNYGGSTGYGREYRSRLDGQWGIVDVDDCCNGALALAQHGLADPQRLAITGGSAGGYTTLAALTFRSVFRAGASHYGIGDLEALARDTHKFESRYLDRLIGPYPECRERYLERSPINHPERLNCPVIFFQGLEDKVVPPNQAEAMVAALCAKGIPVAYLPFAGEQHGFRKAENIKRAIEAEFYFYSRIFRFTPADPIEAVAIHGLSCK